MFVRPRIKLSRETYEAIRARAERRGQPPCTFLLELVLVGWQHHQEINFPVPEKL